MENVSEIPARIVHIPLLGSDVALNTGTLLSTWVIISLMLVFALLIRPRVKRIPGRPAVFFEIIYGSFLDMAKEALGEDGKRFTPLIFTLFSFVLLCNWAGVIPGVKSPTWDLNTCLGLGLMVFVISHAAAVSHKGLKKYLLDYTKPFFLFLPLNIVGELGKVISHSFRLFGNIYAGAVILALAGPVTIKVFNSLGLPSFSASPVLVCGYMILQGFFGLFIGTVQALVFALLALTYIAVLREA